MHKVFCNDFDFTVDFDVGGTRICFGGGSCDDKKYW